MILARARASVRAGKGFIERRRGLGPFRTDLRTKLRALALLPCYARPAGLVVACATACLRLLPTPLLRKAYGVRARLRFRPPPDR